MSDGERSGPPLPLVILLFAVFLGALRMENFRPLAAEILASVLPVFAVWRAVSMLADAHTAIHRTALVIGALIVAGSELAVANVFGWLHLPTHPLALGIGLIVLGLIGATLQGLAAARSLKVRFAATLWIAVGFGVYMASATPVPEKRWIGILLVGFVIGLWGGGLSGLLLGGLATRMIRGPEPLPLPKKPAVKAAKLKA